MNGTRYQDKRFTVPASGGHAKTCAEVGHAWADVRGKCIRCGQKIRDQWGDVKRREPHRDPA